MNKQSWRGKLVVLVCLSSLLGCATADVMRVDDTRRPPTRPSDIKVFVEEPTRPYTTVAVVQASDQGWGLSLEALKQKMVEKAAALGGEAVILGQQSTQSGGTYFIPIGTMLYGTNIPEKHLAGKVIVFVKD